MLLFYLSLGSANSDSYRSKKNIHTFITDTHIMTEMSDKYVIILFSCASSVLKIKLMYKQMI